MDGYDIFALENISRRYKTSNKVIVFFRVLCLLLLLGTVIAPFIVQGVHELKIAFFHLTQWGLVLTIVYFALNLVLFVDKKNTERLGTFFHITFTLELFITIAFWAVILPTDKNYDPSKMSLTTYYVLNSLLHGVPIICLIIDFFLNRIYISGQNIQALFGLLFVYLIVNVFGTLILDYSIYTIITYTDVTTYLIFIITVGLLFVFWVVILKLQKLKYIKGESIFDI